MVDGVEPVYWKVLSAGEDGAAAHAQAEEGEDQHRCYVGRKDVPLRRIWSMNRRESEQQRDEEYQPESTTRPGLLSEPKGKSGQTCTCA